MKADARCRVTEETQAYYRKMESDEREFREFTQSNWWDVQDELQTQEKFERVLDAMVERVYKLTGGKKLIGGDESDRQMIYSALYVACALKFGMDLDTLGDARGSFEADLKKSNAMHDLIKEEIEYRWEQQ